MGRALWLAVAFLAGFVVAVWLVGGRPAPATVDGPATIPTVVVSDPRDAIATRPALTLAA